MDENHAVAEPLLVSKETTEGTSSDPEPSRVCRDCGEEKPEAAFYLNGQGRPDSVCKACRGKRKTEKLRKERKRKVLKKIMVSPPIAEEEPQLPEPHIPALSRQVGGGHYKNFVIQPIEFSTRNGLGFIQGDVVKRICRYNRPGGKGKEDLQKIVHEVEILMEMEWQQWTLDNINRKRLK